RLACLLLCFCRRLPHPTWTTLFPCTTLFRSPVPAGVHALPAGLGPARHRQCAPAAATGQSATVQSLHGPVATGLGVGAAAVTVRSEEHTSELQSRENLVCRLLLEKKKENRRV